MSRCLAGAARRRLCAPSSHVSSGSRSGPVLPLTSKACRGGHELESDDGGRPASPRCLVNLARFHPWRMDALDGNRALSRAN